MMTSLAFDTHKFINNLTAAKMPKKQAEILATQYNEMLSDRLATKDDLKALEKNMDTKVDASKNEIVNQMTIRTIIIMGIGFSILGFLLNN